MASVNKVILVGNLGRDPETRYATSGEKREETEWHRVVFYDRLAEIAGEYLKKGSQVYIEGSLRTRKWTDKEGVEKYTTEIVADRMQMLGSRSGQGDAAGREPPAERAEAKPAAAKKPAGGLSDMDDDIPF